MRVDINLERYFHRYAGAELQENQLEAPALADKVSDRQAAQLITAAKLASFFGNLRQINFVRNAT
jgi:hypothetical protein